MTPEQKQQLEQVREQQAAHSALFDAHDSYKIVQRSEIRTMLNSIDFLLSLVKSQEADRRKRRNPYSEECRAAIDELERLFESEEVELCSIDYVHQREDHSATSMRSACVEKVKATHSSVESACNAALLDVYDLSIANAPMPVKDCREIADCIGDRVGQIRKAIAALTEVLESLSIEKPKE